MITLSNVTFSWPPSFRVTCSECGSVNSPHPSNSVILFFFIRKWTPLTRPSATTRLRSNAAPKSKVTSPLMPKVVASSRTRWASSALRSSALDGMQPTLRHTPPQYLDSTTATLLPSCAARMAATYPPGPAPRTTTSKCGMTASLGLPPRGVDLERHRGPPRTGKDEHDDRREVVPPPRRRWGRRDRRVRRSPAAPLAPVGQ